MYYLLCIILLQHLNYSHLNVSTDPAVLVTNVLRCWSVWQAPFLSNRERNSLAEAVFTNNLFASSMFSCLIYVNTVRSYPSWHVFYLINISSSPSQKHYLFMTLLLQTTKQPRGKHICFSTNTCTCC